MKKLVIFDLDGTLINTITDLALSTNHALEQNNFPAHPVEAYNYFVGNGINKLFERALPEGQKTEENIYQIKKSFLEHYEIHGHDHSAPYPGIAKLLEDLQSKGILLAVASNKYNKATQRLVPHYFPTIHFAEILGQRDGIPPKPDPSIVFDILKTTGKNKEEALYVGDTNVDMQTAISSGVMACGVTWGFRPRTELESFNPDYIIDKPEEILSIIEC